MPLNDRFEHALVMLLVAACAALLVGPAIRLAFHLGIVDRPDTTRKHHAKATAYLGGGVLWTALSLALAILSWNGHGEGLLPAWIALSLLFAVGLADDAWDLPPWSRLLVQGIAVALLLATRLDVPANFGEVLLAVTLLVAGVGVVNAYNLLDGLDGLALGTGLLAASPFFLAAWQGEATGGIAISLAFLAAGTGLLRGNLHPAKIFLGDAGSLLLGGIVFALPLFAFGESRMPVDDLWGAYLPVLLGVPCVDMVVVMWGRHRRGAPMFKGDRTHLHHRLQRVGLSHEASVGVIHLAMSLLVLMHVALVATHRSSWWIAPAALLWIGGYAFLARLEKKATSSCPEGVHHAA